MDAVLHAQPTMSNTDGGVEVPKSKNSLTKTSYIFGPYCVK